ncbi:iron-sulfur cluster assembly scaffold protein [Candidatus Peregrinibacteria bacterium]|nr:iron-sulfur cluster assembly scaffold protein [Candidatus Peregrinibacteria bacterium]MBT4148018.1 iron-sulfur cluster assembly scaffold protein [Candidatus Peregrinibacteria bacterium]MBT4366757.1 iron-sulfur cluster assembly scaffold protein [Candidatus Peregrinibacteria bacterium]MBT4456336.1 iron-sulfur cluster assembly scaffold protein [Candidatus Peregrinibacteria bacterium]
MTEDSKKTGQDSDFKPCCQTGDKVCGKLKHSGSSKKIQTAPNLKKGDKEWVYTDIVRDHFFNPRNLLTPEEEASYEADGVGEVGSPACGDVMKVWIKVDEKSKRITELKWQTFGCGSAISSTSVMSEMVTEDGGMTIDEALDLKAMDINERLGGLPNIKIHCSILGDQALKKAIEDYLGRN